MAKPFPLILQDFAIRLAAIHIVADVRNDRRRMFWHRQGDIVNRCPRYGIAIQCPDNIPLGTKALDFTKCRQIIRIEKTDFRIC